MASIFAVRVPHAVRSSAPKSTKSTRPPPAPT
jgi:hypothetical protein